MLQRLGPARRPAGEPRRLDAASRASRVSAARSAAGRLEREARRGASSPSSSYRPSSSEPTPAALGRVAEAADHAVGRALPLHLHASRRARPSGTAGRAAWPSRRRGRRRRRASHARRRAPVVAWPARARSRLRVAKYRFGERLEPLAPLGQRQVHQRAALARPPAGRTRSSRAGCSADQRPHPARRRVDAQQQLVEREPAVHRDDDLAVEHEALGAERRRAPRRRRGSSGRAACRPCDWSSHRVAVAEREAAEAVPLGLVLPLASARAASSTRSRLHRRDRGSGAAGSQHVAPGGSARARRAAASTDRRARATRAGHVVDAEVLDLDAALDLLPGDRRRDGGPLGRAAPSRPRRACGPTRSGCSRPARARAAAWRSGTRP